MRQAPSVVAVMAGLWACLWLAACANPISSDLRRQADQDVDPAAFLNNPDRYVGRLVILSGVILTNSATQDGALLEILQTPATGSGRPTDHDRSQGRFLVLDRGMTLDPAVWTGGREVIVAGEVIGTRETTIGEVKRMVPLLAARQIHLWERRYAGDRVYDPYYDPYSGPWLGGWGWRGGGRGGVGLGIGGRF